MQPRANLEREAEMWGRVRLPYAKLLPKLGAGIFSPTPTTNLSNLLIEASIYCYLYALNEELKDYPKLLSDF
jgi:hypothetical protein